MEWSSDLHRASFHGDTRSLQHFLDQGHPVDTLGGQMTWLRGASDGLSRTPLHYSAKEGQLESIRLLLRYGADPNARDGDGYTPVHYVCQIHNPPDDIQERVHQCLLSLLEFGGQYKARTNSGHTPLDLARKHRNRVCENELLRQEVHLCSLLVLCRHLVSDLIHRQLLEPVNRLWIPESLKRYLLFEDVLIKWNQQQ